MDSALQQHLSEQELPVILLEGTRSAGQGARAVAGVDRVVNCGLSMSPTHAFGMLGAVNVGDDAGRGPKSTVDRNHRDPTAAYIQQHPSEPSFRRFPVLHRIPKAPR